MLSHSNISCFIVDIFKTFLNLLINLTLIQQQQQKMLATISLTLCKTQIRTVLKKWKDRDYPLYNVC